MPGTYDEEGHALLSVHSWLVEHEGAVILIDTGVGADKSRPAMPVLDHLRPPYLERLALAGVEPEQIDYVLLSHIHADHVGMEHATRERIVGSDFFERDGDLLRAVMVLQRRARGE